MNDFYVYFHYTKDTDRLFYIGKGRGKRYIQKTDRNNWWRNVVEKHGFTAVKIREGMDERSAFSYEIECIAQAKSDGHNICNLTSGGEGCTGVHNGKPKSEATKKKMSENNASKQPKVKEQRREFLLKNNPWNNPDNRRKQILSQPSCPVVCIETGISYISLAHAQRETGANNSSIMRVCKGMQKTSLGLHWKYKEEV
jgi:hypothetical protein